MLDQVLATRYVSPLREGGSLPGIVEADDCGTYVMKFRGAGQGARALVAEVIVGQLGRRIGLRVPELRLVELDPAIARYEADQEVQDLLNASIGLNLGIDFLPGALGYDGASTMVDPIEAATILWLDGFVTNVDRSWQNPNLLLWHKQLWCIDHGAALYFHHGWPTSSNASGYAPPFDGAERFAAAPYAFDKHILSPHLSALADVDARLAGEVSAGLIAEVVGDVPDEWLESSSPSVVRGWYREYLLARLRSPRRWLPEVR